MPKICTRSYVHKIKVYFWKSNRIDVFVANYTYETDKQRQTAFVDYKLYPSQFIELVIQKHNKEKKMLAGIYYWTGHKARCRVSIVLIDVCKPHIYLNCR